jgi:hypothetical protein
VGGKGGGWGQGGEITQALYAHMNKKKLKYFVMSPKCNRPPEPNVQFKTQVCSHILNYSGQQYKGCFSLE